MWTGRQGDRATGGQVDMEVGGTGRLGGRRTCKMVLSWIVRQGGRLKGRQGGKWTGRQGGRWTGRK